jgi:hypothetical protein
MKNWYEGNPQIPVAAEISWAAVGVLAILLLAFAIFSLLRQSGKFFSPVLYFWIAALILFPFVGAVAWLTIGRYVHSRAPKRLSALSLGRQVTRTGDSQNL